MMKNGILQETFFLRYYKAWAKGSYVPGSKLVIFGMVIPPLIGNPYNGYVNPYYELDDHPYHRKTMGV